MTTPRWQSSRHLISGDRSTLDEVSIHTISCTPEGPIKGTILLIHGFPGTSWQWRHVIDPLADAGYQVIAPDYRGAGHSSHPRSGYDKITMATDLHTLMQTFGVNKVHLVAYDIGGKIAAAYAFQFPEHTASIFWGEGPIPGSTVWEEAIANPYSPIWHFILHWQPDIPELLVDTPAKVKIYITHFLDRLANNRTAITADDIERYTAAYSQPGGIRAACDVYRAFHQDDVDNKAFRAEKSRIPCMAVDGSVSPMLGLAERQANEFFKSVEGAVIEGSGHYLAEEQPENFVRVVLDWVARH